MTQKCVENGSFFSIILEISGEKKFRKLKKEGKPYSLSMNFDFIVLGASGMQGKIVSRDLLESGYKVLMCDKDKPMDKALLNFYKDTSSFIRADVNDLENTIRLIKLSGSGVVVNCVEGDWNLHVLDACIEAGAHSIDLGSEIWMTKKQFKKDALLKEKELTHITGSGSVPGIGNVMLKYAATKFDSLDTIEIGFAWDSNIKEFVVPFSIQSITEEFSQKADVLENGKFLKTSPLATVHERVFRGIGKQKCFIARHSETYTFYHYYKHMGLKNVRFYAGFPDHSYEVIKHLVNLGFGNQKKLNFYGSMIKPVDYLTFLLRKIKPPEDYTENENLWVKVFGEKNGKEKIIEMECLVPTIEGWEDAGCNIDTGFPTSILAQMLRSGVISERGAFAPEGIVPTSLFFKELMKRQMVIYENGNILKMHDTDKEPDKEIIVSRKLSSDF